MKKDEFREFLEKRLAVEKEHGFRHCAVMLAEIIEMYDAPKERNCKKCGKLFIPESDRLVNCPECRGAKRCRICGVRFSPEKKGDTECPDCVMDQKAKLKKLAEDLARDA